MGCPSVTSQKGTPKVDDTVYLLHSCLLAQRCGNHVEVKSLCSGTKGHDIEPRTIILLFDQVITFPKPCFHHLQTEVHIILSLKSRHED